LNKASNGPSIYTCNNDTDLINITNRIASQSYTSATQCLVYYLGQNDKLCANIDYPAIVTNGLVLNLDAGFVPSYPRSGTTWSDLSVNQYDGLLTNGPIFQSANDGSLLFDGIDDYVNFGTTGESLIRNASELTINFYVKITQFINPLGFAWAPITCIDRFNLGNSYRKFTIYAYTSGGNQFLVCDYYNGTGGSSSASKNYTVLNTIINVCSTCDSNYNTLYVNGVQQHQTTGISINTNPLTSDFTIASRINTTSNNYFKGNIYSAQFYNRALTAAEVLQNYNATKGRFGL